MNVDGTGQTLLYDGNPGNATPAVCLSPFVARDRVQERMDVRFNHVAIVV